MQGKTQQQILGNRNASSAKDHGACSSLDCFEAHVLWRENELLCVTCHRTSDIWHELNRVWPDAEQSFGISRPIISQPDYLV